MPIGNNSFVPHIVEQIFQRYEKGNKNQVLDTSLNIPKQFLIELNAVFGNELLEHALQLLDTHTITFYYSETKVRALVEISSGKSAHVVKLLPGLNFCPCRHFARQVLRLDNSPLSLTASTSDIAKHNATDQKHCYTCPHVLGVRLAQILKASCLHEEILQNNKFTYLLQQMFTVEK